MEADAPGDEAPACVPVVAPAAAGAAAADDTSGLSSDDSEGGSLAMAAPASQPPAGGERAGKRKRSKPNYLHMAAADDDSAATKTGGPKKRARRDLEQGTGRGRRGKEKRPGRAAAAAASKQQQMSTSSSSNLRLPMALRHDGVVVHSLGRVDARPGYHNKHFIYPIGFISSREHWSLADPQAQCLYVFSILDGGEKPRFEVVCSDLPMQTMAGTGPTSLWLEVLQAVSSKTGYEDPNLPTNGTEAFGIWQVKGFIEQLPGADGCSQYQRTNPNYAAVDGAAALDRTVALQSAVDEYATLFPPELQGAASDTRDFDDDDEDEDYSHGGRRTGNGSDTFDAEMCEQVQTVHASLQERLLTIAQVARRIEEKERAYLAEDKLAKKRQKQVEREKKREEANRIKEEQRREREQLREIEKERKRVEKQQLTELRRQEALVAQESARLEREAKKEEARLFREQKRLELRLRRLEDRQRRTEEERIPGYDIRDEAAAEDLDLKESLPLPAPTPIMWLGAEGNALVGEAIAVLEFFSNFGFFLTPRPKFDRGDMCRVVLGQGSEAVAMAARVHDPLLRHVFKEDGLYKCYYTSWLKNLPVTTTSFQCILLAYLQSFEEFCNTQGDIMVKLETGLYTDLTGEERLHILNFMIFQAVNGPTIRHYLEKFDTGIDHKAASLRVLMRERGDCVRAIQLEEYGMDKVDVRGAAFIVIEVLQMAEFEGRNMTAIFMDQPLRSEYPDYYRLIRHPIALNDIIAKARDGKYSSASRVMTDLELMFNNAFTYNSTTSVVHQDALRLQEISKQTMQILMRNGVVDLKDPDTLTAEDRAVQAAAHQICKDVKKRMNERIETGYEALAVAMKRFQGELLGHDRHFNSYFLFDSMPGLVVERHLPVGITESYKSLKTDSIDDDDEMDLGNDRDEPDDEPATQEEPVPQPQPQDGTAGGDKPADTTAPTSPAPTAAASSEPAEEKPATTAASEPEAAREAPAAGAAAAASSESAAAPSEPAGEQPTPDAQTNGVQSPADPAPPAEGAQAAPAVVDTTMGMAVNDDAATPAATAAADPSRPEGNGGLLLKLSRETLEPILDINPLKEHHFYSLSTEAELTQLLEALNKKGQRESWLHDAVSSRKQRILASMRRVATEPKPLTLSDLNLERDSKAEMLQVVKEQLADFADKIFLRKFMERETPAFSHAKWAASLASAESHEDLKPLLREIVNALDIDFFKKTWQPARVGFFQSLMAAPSLSEYGMHFAVLESIVRWNRIQDRQKRARKATQRVDMLSQFVNPDDLDDEDFEDDVNDDAYGGDDDDPHNFLNRTNCHVCGDGGEVLCCDYCPNVFHMFCLDPPLAAPPIAKWKCPLCTSMKPDYVNTSGVLQEFDVCRTCHTGGQLLWCSSCPNCYHLQCLQPPLEKAPEDDWFCVSCCTAYPVVWAKVRGYPSWPAKVIEKKSNRFMLRFFGTHDSTWMAGGKMMSFRAKEGQLKDLQNHKDKNYRSAIEEVAKYVEHMRQQTAQASELKTLSGAMEHARVAAAAMVGVAPGAERAPLPPPAAGEDAAGRRSDRSAQWAGISMAGIWDEDFASSVADTASKALPRDADPRRAAAAAAPGNGAAHSVATAMPGQQTGAGGSDGNGTVVVVGPAPAPIPAPAPAPRPRLSLGKPASFLAHHASLEAPESPDTSSVAAAMET